MEESRRSWQPGSIVREPLVTTHYDARLMTATSMESLGIAVCVSGGAIVYRLHDVGYAIHIGRAQELLAPRTPERERPTRGEAQAIQIKNPPLTVTLGRETLIVNGVERPAEISARVFDFGVVSLRLRVDAPPGSLPWREFEAFGVGLETASWGAVLDRHLAELIDRIRPAIERPALSPVREEYVVFRVGRLVDPEGRRLPTECLRDEDVAALLLNERRSLSPSARAELLPNRFSYTVDDLAILTWDNALIVEPIAEDTDVQYVLEFANAQLLELRVYDTLLDAELPRMYERVGSARRRPGALLRLRFAPILGELQTLVADITEPVERVENSLKLTDDVYLARIYSAALEIFRGRVWRRSIDRKLEIIRDTYSMLNGEAQATRAELLELSIVLLIVFEIVLVFVR
jgi:hypothetical protein